MVKLYAFRSFSGRVARSTLKLSRWILRLTSLYRQANSLGSNVENDEVVWLDKEFTPGFHEN